MKGLKITAGLLWLSTLSLTVTPLQCEGFFDVFAIRYECPQDPNVHFNGSHFNALGFGSAYVAEEGGIFVDTTSRGCRLFERVYTAPGGVSLNSIEHYIRPHKFNIVVGDSGTIVTNVTGSWTTVPSPTHQNLNALCTTGDRTLPTVAYAVGDSGIIIRSTDAGLTWSLLSSPTTLNLNAIMCSYPIIRVAGDDVAGYHSSDGGASWEQYNFYMTGATIGFPGGPPDLFSITFVDDRYGFAFGEFGVAFRTLDSGTTWLSSIVPGFDDINTSYFINKDTGAVAGENGMISFTTDGGQNWFEDSTMSSLTTHTINQLVVYDSTLVSIVGDSGTVIYFSTDSSRITNVSAAPGIPDGFALFQNYPNPFNPTTTIRFHIPTVAPVSLMVYDMLGRIVATLVDENLAPGKYSVEWDATGFASGVYFYRLTDGVKRATRKLVILK